MSTPHPGSPAVMAEGLVPLVIGVTGHRNLDRRDYPLYRTRIAGLLDYLRTRYPSTPLRMVSALAEGADRVAAEVGLEHGCELLVCLPMTAAEYERDFPGSVAEFRALLARVPPANVFVLQPHVPLDTTPADLRELCYREVGLFVSGRCHILLALWDGIRNESFAGTAEVVRFKLEGRAHPATRGLDVDYDGPVFWVRARRSGGSGGTGDPELPGKWLFAAEANAELLRTVCLRIDRFNSEALRVRGSAAVAESADSLIPGLASRPAGDRALAVTFACADVLARRYQKMTHRILRVVITLAVALALTFEVYSEILAIRAMPELYLGIFSAIVLLYLWQRRQDTQGRYLDYRALAEGLRVQFYWRLAGLADNVSTSYLRKQLDELRWIREALRGSNVLAPPTEPRADLVLAHWVRGQADYFRSRAKLQMTRIHHVELLSAISLAAGLVATTSLVVFWRRLESMGTWHHWVVLVMGFAPIAAALWETYGERFGLRSQAHQYARFATVFGRAEKVITHLEATPSDHHRQHSERALIRELGREALMESGDWVLLLRERPIVLPKG
ncbi:MAG TPA: hypothetical protein VGI91_03110 [Steroidobacteraceae bacterium]